MFKNAPYVILLFLLSVNLPQWTFAQSRFKKSRAVDAAVKQEMKKQELVGVAIGVIRDSKVVYTQGYGFSNLANKEPVTNESVFNWASNSKPVIAVLAMQLVQKGNLDLDQPISKYIPKLPEQFRKITSRQLLCHQSGMPHYSNGEIKPSKKTISPSQEFDPFNCIHRFAFSPLIFEPGTKIDYSSYAFVLLTAVVQSAGEKKIDEQISERLSKRLNLKSFQLDVPFEEQQNWVTAYKMIKGKPEPIEDYAHYWKHGAGGYKSNVEDFARFACALMNRKLINKKTSLQMWTNQETADGKPTVYGLGVRVEGQGSSLKISHGGTQDETRTRMVLYPRKKHGVVVMCNMRSANPGKISTAIYTALNAR